MVQMNPVDGRWHGTSMLDVFWQLQKFGDLTANRWDLSLSQSADHQLWQQYCLSTSGLWHQQCGHQRFPDNLSPGTT
jgi:hypothetical protein